MKNTIGRYLETTNIHGREAVIVSAVGSLLISRKGYSKEQIPSSIAQISVGRVR